MSEVTPIHPRQQHFMVEAEQQALGALLLNADLFDVHGGRLSADLFYDPVHAQIYRVMRERHDQGHLVSPVALAPWAESYPALGELGGARYLVKLAGFSVMPGQLGHYLDMLADLRAKRDLRDMLDEAMHAIDNELGTPTEIAARLEAQLIDTEIPSGRNLVSMMSAVSGAIEQAHAAYHGDTGNRVPTGLPSLDKMTSGFAPGDLVVLGGRPSMGKTAIAVSIALHVARTTGGVGFGSAEMMPEGIALRAISEGTAEAGRGVNYQSVIAGDMTEDQFRAVVDAAGYTQNLPIFFTPPDVRDLGGIYAGMKRAKAQLGDAGLKLIVVDYIQLLNADARSRVEEIGRITQGLKALGAQMGCPVLALSQLSRQVEQRDDKRPRLSDLRDSGSIEQDADTVLFAYREEYYLDRERPAEGSKSEELEAHTELMLRAKGKLELIVAKQRQGPIGTARLKINPALNRIWEG